MKAGGGGAIDVIGAAVGGIGVNVAVGGTGVKVGVGTSVWVGRSVAVGRGVFVTVGMNGGNVDRDVDVAVGEGDALKLHPTNTSKTQRHREKSSSALIHFQLDGGR